MFDTGSLWLTIFARHLSASLDYDHSPKAGADRMDDRTIPGCDQIKKNQSEPGLFQSATEDNAKRALGTRG
jgi:hypothetical protein